MERVWLRLQAMPERQRRERIDEARRTPYHGTLRDNGFLARMDGQQFVDCMVRGDATVWERLLPQLRAIALGACRKLQVFDEIKEDIVQDVALKVFTDWRSYRLESEFDAWIYSIARNRCIDALRKRVVRGDHRLPEDVSQAFADHERREPYRLFHPSLEQTLCVQQMIMALDAEGDARKGSMRAIEVVRWLVLDGGSPDELAVFLKTTPGAAKTRKSAILKRVRELCQKFCGDDECGMAATI